MEYIHNLRISDLRLYPRWTDAPLGTVLQMPVPIPKPRIIIGMRTRHQAANASLEAIVVLGGEQAGSLITEAYLGGAADAGPALDVSSQVEIIAVDAAPFKCREGVPLDRGALLRQADNERTFFVWTTVNETVVTGGGLCVASEDKKSPVGTCNNLDKNKLIGVARKVDVWLREVTLVHDVEPD